MTCWEMQKEKLVRAAKNENVAVFYLKKQLENVERASGHAAAEAMFESMVRGDRLKDPKARKKEVAVAYA